MLPLPSSLVGNGLAVDGSTGVCIVLLGSNLEPNHTISETRTLRRVMPGVASLTANPSLDPRLLICKAGVRVPHNEGENAQLLIIL